MNYDYPIVKNQRGHLKSTIYKKIFFCNLHSLSNKIENEKVGK